VLDYAREHGVGAAVYSPLAGGQLTDNTLVGGDPHPLSGAALRARAGAGAAGGRARPVSDQASAFRFLSVPGRQTLAQAAVRFILMNPSVTSVLGGFSDTAQLAEGVAAVDVEPLNQESMVLVEAAWRSNLGQSKVETQA
jgi:aryl-alcohol dehydrogenase-like predicted oxidoreductase